MVIEYLKVKVPPEVRETYLQKDAEIWTRALARYSGFLGKEVWINPEDESEVIFIVRWETRSQWKAIPQAELDAIDAEFERSLGAFYPISEVREYQVWG